MCSWLLWSFSLLVSAPKPAAPMPFPILFALKLAPSQRWTLCPPDRPGVTKRDHIDHLQENVALTLQSYIRSQQTAPRNRYKKDSEGPIQPTPTQLTRPGWHPHCTPQQFNFPRLYSVDIKVAAGSQLSLPLGPSPWPAPDYPIQLPMVLLHSQL